MRFAVLADVFLAVIQFASFSPLTLITQNTYKGKVGEAFICEAMAAHAWCPHSCYAL